MSRYALYRSLLLPAELLNSVHEKGNSVTTIMVKTEKGTHQLAHFLSDESAIDFVKFHKQSMEEFMFHKQSIEAKEDFTISEVDMHVIQDLDKATFVGFFMSHEVAVKYCDFLNTNNNQS